MSDNLYETTSDGLKMPKTSIGGGSPSTFGIPKQEKSAGQPQSTVLDLKTLSEIWKTVYDDIKNRGSVPRYKIGLRELDEILWGLHKRELLTIGARTSHGKSALALQIALSLVDAGSRVVFFSLEMSKEQLLERMLANMCNIDNRWLRHGIAGKTVDDRKETFEKLIENIKLLIDDQYGYNLDNIEKVCELIGPDFIIVDYIQMISTKGYRNKLDAIEEYVQRIKQLANQRNMGVVLISQINRAGEHGEMSMANLKWAGVLEEHSDSVVILEWIRKKDKYKVRVEKQRHGTTGELSSIRFVPEYFRFEDVVPTAQKRKDIN